MLELFANFILFIPIILGYFYLKFRHLFKKNKRSRKKKVKPYYLMDKKELKKLESEVELNLLERNKVIRALKFLRETKSLNVDMIIYIKDIVVEDTEMKFSNKYSFFEIIEMGINNGYVSNNSLNLIKTKIEDVFLTE